MARRRARRGTGGTGYDRHRRAWYARVYTRGVDGKRIAPRLWVSDADAADEALKVLRARFGVDAADDEPLSTLGAYLDAWLASHERSLRPATAASYRSHVRLHIKPLLGGIPLHRLRPRDVDRLVADRLAADLAPISVVRIVTTLRIALGRAVKRRLIPDNAAALASLPKVEHRIVPAMTEAQRDRIVEVTAPTWLGPIVRFILGSGLRVGEACGLDWGDAHEDDGWVLVRVSKTRQRVQPITDDAAGVLRGLRAGRKRIASDAPVFVMTEGPRKGERLLVQSVSHALPDLLEANKLPRVTPHGLRHGYATLLVARGVHHRLVGELLGHQDGGVLAMRTYAHVVPGHLRDAARTLDRRSVPGSVTGPPETRSVASDS